MKRIFAVKTGDRRRPYVPMFAPMPMAYKQAIRRGLDLSTPRAVRIQWDRATTKTRAVMVAIGAVKLREYRNA